MAHYTDRTDYIRRLFAQETPAMQAARAAATAEAADNISLHPEEGKLLQLLAQMAGAKKIVEIGTFYGYSALWLADALPAGGHLWTLEKDAARAARARDFIGDRPDITLVEGDALQSLSGMAPEGPFDMVFIDADKLSYAAYLDWAEENLRTGGLVVGDNTFLFDAVWQDGPVERVRETARAAMRDFNRRLADPARYRAVMLATGEGLTIAQKIF